MHQISDESLQVAQKHAALVEQHREQIQNIANRLEQDDHIIEIEKEQIKERGELMQESAHGMFDAVDNAQQHPEKSIEAFGLAIEQHIQANQQHIEAMKILRDTQLSQKDKPIQEM